MWFSAAEMRLSAQRNVPECKSARLTQTSKAIKCVKMWRVWRLGRCWGQALGELGMESLTRRRKTGFLNKNTNISRSISVVQLLGVSLWHIQINTYHSRLDTLCFRYTIKPLSCRYIAELSFRFVTVVHNEHSFLIGDDVATSATRAACVWLWFLAVNPLTGEDVATHIALSHKARKYFAIASRRWGGWCHVIDIVRLLWLGEHGECKAESIGGLKFHCTTCHK